MKAKKILGFWDNLPIWRNETPRETLERQIKYDKDGSKNLKGAELFADIIEKKLTNYHE